MLKQVIRSINDWEYKDGGDGGREMRPKYPIGLLLMEVDCAALILQEVGFGQGERMPCVGSLKHPGCCNEMTSERFFWLRNEEYLPRCDDCACTCYPFFKEERVDVVCTRCYESTCERCRDGCTCPEEDAY